ncbi:transposase [Acetobacter fabarum]|nr:transposase [Acetobacter fabarum]
MCLNGALYVLRVSPSSRHLHERYGQWNSTRRWTRKYVWHALVAST